MTSLTKKQLAALPPAGRALYKIWLAVPDGPLSEDELHSAILSTTGHNEGDLAFADAMRSSLTSASAVTARRDAAGAVEYMRAKAFPIWPPNGPGSESFNEQLVAIQTAEHEARDRSATAAYESSHEARQRADMVRLIDGRFHELFDELVRAEDVSVRERLRARLRNTKNANAA
jgi:hypothetical protein